MKYSTVKINFEDLDETLKEIEKERKVKPNSLENRVSTLEAKQDILIEDNNYLKSKLNDIYDLLLDKDTDDECDCECDCECDECKSESKESTKDALNFLKALSESLTLNDEDEDEDDEDEDVVETIYNDLDSLLTFLYKVSDLEYHTSEDDFEDDDKVLEKIHAILKGYFKDRPVTMAYDGDGNFYASV